MNNPVLRWQLPNEGGDSEGPELPSAAIAGVGVVSEWCHREWRLRFLWQVNYRRVIDEWVKSGVGFNPTWVKRGRRWLARMVPGQSEPSGSRKNRKSPRRASGFTPKRVLSAASATPAFESPHRSRNPLQEPTIKRSSKLNVHTHS